MTTPLSDSALLQRLIGFDTTSARSNRHLIDFLADYLDGPKVQIVHRPSPDGLKVNLIVTLGPDDPDRGGLTLAGHTDVVPATEAAWTSDPFQAVIRDGTIVGRGASDMKGFIAVAANAFRHAAEGPVEAPLALVFTYDEELGALGARHLVETWEDIARIPRRVIVGEPTSLQAVRAHKGHLKLRITIEGVGAHSALPHLGRNAIEPGARAVTALAGLRTELERERSPGSSLFPTVPFNSLNVARIRGGEAVNIIPDACTIDVGIRVIPGCAPDTLTERVRTTLVDTLGPDAFHLEDTGMTPPMILDATADPVADVRALTHTHADHGVDFGTDAGWLQQIPCECVVFGPGTMDVAHKPNEHLPLSQLANAAVAVTSLVRRWCGPAVN